MWYGRGRALNLRRPSPSDGISPFDDVDEWLTCDDSAHLFRKHLLNPGFKRRGVPSHVRCDECVWGPPEWVFVWQGFGVNHVECR